MIWVSERNNLGRRQGVLRIGLAGGLICDVCTNSLFSMIEEHILILHYEFIQSKFSLGSRERPDRDPESTEKREASGSTGIVWTV